MGHEPEPIEVPVRDYDELVGELYEIATKYRESFEGMAISHDAGADIFVAVQDEGRRQRYVFTNPNPQSMRSLWRSLSTSGYLERNIILHENIILDVSEYLEKRRLDQERAEAAKAEVQRRAVAETARDRREGRRWWTSLLVQSTVAIAAAVIAAVLADYYSSRSLKDEMSKLKTDVTSLKAAVRATAPAAAGPTSRPMPQPQVDVPPLTAASRRSSASGP